MRQEHAESWIECDRDLAAPVPDHSRRVETRMIALLVESYRRKAGELLGQAAAAANLAERGRLIDEAASCI